MKKRPDNHFESYEAACASLGLDPEAILPIVPEAAPEWLKKFTIASVKLAIICEAMRGGRKPKLGEWMYIPVFFKDAKNNNAAFEFTYTRYGSWLTATSVGERLSLFSEIDAEWFGRQFLDLHRDTKII